MKKKYEAYAIGSEVWAISFWYHNGEITDHCAIYRAEIAEICIKGNPPHVGYYLKTLGGEDWGFDEVDEINVSDDFDVLMNRAKELWKENE